MLNKSLIAAALVMTLSACGSDEFDRAAQRDAQRSLQSQYSSMAECQMHFSHPNDCYRGTSGFFYSPIYYPWGAVMHRDNTVTYNNTVPAVGRPVMNTRAPSVNFNNSQSYVASRASVSRASYSSSSVSRGGFGSSASRASFGSAGG
jgi:hypothetical protein